MLPDWLDVDTLSWVIPVVIVAIMVIMVLVGRFVTKLVTKVVLLVILAGLGVSLWVQRVELGDCVEQGECRLYGRDVRFSPEADS